MDMQEFADFSPNKFLVVLGKMNAAVFGRVEKHLKTIGYNTTEFLIMYAIAAHGKLTIQDIAGRIFVTSGNMTYTIDKLEKRHLLHRIPCPQDRRKIYVDFTDQGKETWDQRLEEHVQYLESLFADIDEEALLDTIRSMKLIGKGIQ